MKQTKSEKVDVIGIGMPRCGTTWLSKCLGEHPEICYSKDKETHYFDTYYKQEDVTAFLERQFKHFKDGQLRAEFTTVYYQSEEVLKRIKKVFPDVKILFIVRNPYDRVFSHYLYRKRKNGTPKQISELFESDKHGVVDASLYGKYLKRTIDIFGEGNVIIANNDDARVNPTKYIQRVYKELGVDSSFVPQSVTSEINRSKDLQYKINAFEWMFTYRMRMRKNPIGGLIIKIAKITRIHNFLVWLRGKNKIRDEEHAEKESLSNVDKEVLKGVYTDDIKQFEKISGMDISAWIK